VAATGPVAGQPWTNSLGVKFVPAGTDGVLFSVWDVRVQDYQTFVTATGHDWSKPSFSQTDNDPAVNVSWDDAYAFCDWLTKKEQAEGSLASNQKYRLPTDAEWSKAVGLNESADGTPARKSMKITGVYPWGTQWPPPSGAGNYPETLTHDGYANTSPVGSFTANSYGLYDMGGNVWQWCEDKYNNEHDWRVLRGASWFVGGPQRLLSSCRNGVGPGDRFDDGGFRVVVVVSP
jgi:formylglycine-generating enzyme required for sulfatase activity